MLDMRKTISTFLVLIFIGGVAHFLLNKYLVKVNVLKDESTDMVQNIKINKNEGLIHEIDVRMMKTKESTKSIELQESEVKWQTVSGMKNHKMFVYSAFYDVRHGIDPSVRIIGVTKTKRPESVICRMYYEHNHSQLFRSVKWNENSIPAELKTKIKFFRDVPGKISIIWGHHRKKYSACFILCPITHEVNLLNKNDVKSPSFVSVIPFLSNQSYSTNILPVLNSENGGTGTYEVKKKNLGVCVKPVHSNYNQTQNLIEFIEFNKILGATKFTFYNLTMSDDIDCILNFYKNYDNSVQVMQWDLPKNEPNLDLHDTGGLAARNDCVYRNMNNFRYLMMTDLDEFIIPRQHKYITEMLDHLNEMKLDVRHKSSAANSGSIASYNFKNAFFYLHYGKNRYINCQIEISI